VTAALDVSYPAHTVSEVGRSCAVETAERQNTGRTKSQWCCSTNCGHPIARVSRQLDMWHAASKHTTAPINHTRPSAVSIHQMAPPLQGSRHPIIAYYSFNDLERLSWPSWLTCSGRFTHASGHLSAAGRAQDRESSSAKDRRSTTVPCHQLCVFPRDVSKTDATRITKHDVDMVHHES